MAYVFLFVILAVCVVFIVRNELVFRARIRAIKVASNRATESIGQGEFDSWMRHYDHIDSFGSYDRMLFDLRKWSFSQFYRGL